MTGRPIPSVPHSSTQATPSDPMRPRLYVVRDVQKDTRDTFTLLLTPRTPADGQEGPTGPGQFNMLYVFGFGEVPISMSGDPVDVDVLVHTTRQVGIVTRAMGALRAGATVGVRGPFGTAWPLAQAVDRDVVLVAGGIGLAPLRPLIYRLLAQRDRYGRVSILVGARTPEDLLYADELRAWRARLDVDVHVTVDRATGSWRGNVGLVTALIPRSRFDPRNAVAMVCGPEPMMTAAAMALVRRDVSRERIWLSLERNMKCAIGHCGHCQLGPLFVCRDGPVFRLDRIAPLLDVKEV